MSLWLSRLALGDYKACITIWQCALSKTQFSHREGQRSYPVALQEVFQGAKSRDILYIYIPLKASNYIQLQTKYIFIIYLYILIYHCLRQCAIPSIFNILSNGQQSVACSLWPWFNTHSGKQHIICQLIKLNTHFLYILYINSLIYPNYYSYQVVFTLLFSMSPQSPDKANVFTLWWCECVCGWTAGLSRRTAIN